MINFASWPRILASRSMRYPSYWQIISPRLSIRRARTGASRIRSAWSRGASRTRVSPTEGPSSRNLVVRIDVSWSRTCASGHVGGLGAIIGCWACSRHGSALLLQADLRSFSVQVRLGANSGPFGDTPLTTGQPEPSA